MTFQRGPLRCYKCNRLGHMAKDCWARPTAAMEIQEYPDFYPQQEFQQYQVIRRIQKLKRLMAAVIKRRSLLLFRIRPDQLSETDSLLIRHTRRILQHQFQ